jgi:hypothetical protein
MDETTFGKFDAARRLAREVIIRPKLANKIGNFLQDYTKGLSDIENAAMPDKTFQRRILALWKDEFLKHANNYSGIDTLLKNVIIAYWRNTVMKIQ